MADISKVNSVEWGNLAGVGGVAKASIGKLGGTLDAPASGPTAADVLVHWWKMNDGAETAADFGTATGTGTEITHVGATSSTGGGPSAIGSPDCISYDGSNDHSWVKLRGAAVGTETTVGTNTTSDETFTIALWMKDVSSGGYNYSTWIDGFTKGTWDDGFVWWFKNDMFLKADHWNITTSKIDDLACLDSTWHHYFLEFNNPSPSGTTAGPSTLFSLTQDNSTVANHASGSYLSTELTTVGGTDVRLAFGGLVANSSLGASAYNTQCLMSDIRVYSRVLTSGEKTAIYAGDW